jgi:tRNA-2-methylthio-N6-dimethylallyladenosine synthase
VDGIDRIRFASPHPRHVDDRFIDAMERLPKVCRHLHLPVQSGSTSVLQAMRRRYTREAYLSLIERIRERLPEVALSTDMIVGFPTETEADFEDTLTLTAAVGYHSMFSFKYSPRPNTLAEQRLPDQVSEDEKTRRIVALQALQREIQGGLNERLVGLTVDVLVDRAAAGYPVVGTDEHERGREPPGPLSWVPAGPGAWSRPVRTACGDKQEWVRAEAALRQFRVWGDAMQIEMSIKG